MKNGFIYQGNAYKSMRTYSSRQVHIIYRILNKKECCLSIKAIDQEAGLTATVMAIAPKNRGLCSTETNPYSLNKPVNSSLL